MLDRLLKMGHATTLQFPKGAVPFRVIVRAGAGGSADSMPVFAAQPEPRESHAKKMISPCLFIARDRRRMARDAAAFD